MSGSLEHRTFRYHYATLKAGLGRSLNVDKAYARELITREERDDAKSGRTLDEQNGKFLDMVELRIIDNPRKYYDFLKILKEEAAFANLVDKLTSTFEYRLIIIYSVPTENNTKLDVQDMDCKGQDFTATLAEGITLSWLALPHAQYHAAVEKL